MRLLFPIIVPAIGLLLVSCGEQMSAGDHMARNCQLASEGEELFEKYREKLVTAKDWEAVGWTRQVPMAKLLACRHKLSYHAPLDDCLDNMAYDEKQGQLPFQQAIDQCVGDALKKKAGS